MAKGLPLLAVLFVSPTGPLRFYYKKKYWKRNAFKIEAERPDVVECTNRFSNITPSHSF